MIGFGSINRPYPTGACAPSAPARGALLAADYGRSAPNLRLDHEEAIDLVRAERYPRWLARIQGRRQTCIAFAVAASVKILRARDGNDFTALSPQFLYGHMRTRGPAGDAPPGWELGATKLSHARD